MGGAHVADTVPGGPIGDGIFGYGGLETIGVRNDPAGQATPIGEAADAHSIGVSETFFNRMIYRCHQVGILQLHVMGAVDGVAETVAVSGRAAIVDEQNGIARAGQHLEVEGEDVAPAMVGATVNVEDGGIRGRAAGRFHQPSLHRNAVAAGAGQAYGFRLRHTRQQLGVEVGELPFMGAVHIHLVEIGRHVEVGGRYQQAAVMQADGVTGAVAAHHHFTIDVTLQGDPIHLHFAAILNAHIGVPPIFGNLEFRVIAVTDRHICLQGAFDIADQPGCAALGRSPLAIDHPQVVLGAEGRVDPVADEYHARAVRRPDRGVGGIAPLPDQIAHIAIQIGHPQRGKEAVFVREECGREQDLLTVGRPFRRGVAAVVILIPGQVAHLSPCGRHDKDVMHGVVKIAHCVEPVDLASHPVRLGRKNRFRSRPR